MQHAGEILKRALGGLARPKNAFDWIEAVWPVVLGARLAARARPVAWRAGALDVRVESAGWRSELEGLAERLRGELNRAWGGELVREMRFTSGEDAPPTPFVRRGARLRPTERGSGGQARHGGQAGGADASAPSGEPAGERAKPPGRRTGPPPSGRAGLRRAGPPRRAGRPRAKK